MLLQGCVNVVESGSQPINVACNDCSTVVCFRSSLLGLRRKRSARRRLSQSNTPTTKRRRRRTRSSRALRTLTMMTSWRTQTAYVTCLRVAVNICTPRVGVAEWLRRRTLHLMIMGSIPAVGAIKMMIQGCDTSV